MKKKLVAFLLAAVMTIAATVIPAAAGNYDNIDFSAVKGANFYINSYDNITVCVQGEAGDPGMLGRDHVADCYGLILFCTADSTANLNLVYNAAGGSGWSEDTAAKTGTYDGGVYYYILSSKSPFTNGEDYSQYCVCNWSGSPCTIVGYALLDKNGNYLGVADAKAGTFTATSPVAGASLPKTGVVSAAVLYAIGSALVGAGVVVTKKSRKED